MPNFDETEHTDNPSTTYDVSATYDESVKTNSDDTKSEIIKDESPLEKVTTDEPKEDNNKKLERNSLQRDVSVDALSSKKHFIFYALESFVNFNLFIADNLKSLSAIKPDTWNAPIPIFNNGNLCL